MSAEYILLGGLVGLGVVLGLQLVAGDTRDAARTTACELLSRVGAGASYCGAGGMTEQAGNPGDRTFDPLPRNQHALTGGAQGIQQVAGSPDANPLDFAELDPGAFSGMDRTEIRTALIEAGIPPTQAALRAGAIYRANHPGLDGVQVADTSGAWDFSTRTTPVEPVTGRPIPPVPPGHANTNTPPIRIVAGTAIDGTPRAPVQVVHPQPNVVGSAFKRAGGNILAALATGVVFAAADYYFTPEVARLPEVEGDFSDYQLDAEGRWLVDLDGNPVRHLSEHRLLGFSWGRHLVMNNDHELFYLHNNWTFRSHPVPPEAMLPGATAQDLIDAALAAQHNPDGWNTPWTATELFDPASHRADSLRRFVWTERGGATFEWDAEAQQWVQIGGVALLPEELLMAANSLGAGPPGALAPTLETTMSAEGPRVGADTGSGREKEEAEEEEPEDDPNGDGAAQPDEVAWEDHAVDSAAAPTTDPETAEHADTHWGGVDLVIGDVPAGEAPDGVSPRRGWFPRDLSVDVGVSGRIYVPWLPVLNVGAGFQRYFRSLNRREQLAAEAATQENGLSKKNKRWDFGADVQAGVVSGGQWRVTGSEFAVQFPGLGARVSRMQGQVRSYYGSFGFLGLGAITVGRMQEVTLTHPDTGETKVLPARPAYVAFQIGTGLFGMHLPGASVEMAVYWPALNPLVDRLFPFINGASRRLDRVNATLRRWIRGR